ncbi:MAG: hypothetical protein CUN55_11235 [Phototrophicales bacterium]|nr:MAG: hypothetical protein CUN55_11235 [Phototrophicales bacterium]
MSYGEFLRRVATVFAFATFLILFWMLRGVFLVAFLSLILALFLGIPSSYLQRFGMGRRYAVTATVITTIAAAVLFLVFLVPVSVSSILVLIEELPDAYEQVVENYTEWRSEQNESFRSLLPELSSETTESTRKAIVPRTESTTRSIPIESVTSIILPSLGELGQIFASTIATIALIIIVSLFFLAAPIDYLRSFMYLIPPSHHEKAALLISEIHRALRGWMSAMALSITVTFSLVSIWLNIILEIPNGIAIGIIAGLMTLIPNIGVVVPLIPIVIFTLADDPSKLPAALIGYYFIQQIEGNFITPLFVKQQVNIPAGIVLMFQLVAAVLFGFLGILLAVPLLVVVMVVIRELYVYDMLGLRGKVIDVVYLQKEQKFKVVVKSSEAESA